MFRRIVSGVTLGVATCAVLGLIDGCLTRPVVSSSPVTKTNFITSIPQGSIDKVDLLFDIDNSASMGDKQAYLSKAIPDLLKRLVQPNCINSAGAITGSSMLNGDCADPDSAAEFPPVHNMHVGILSSSLGARLGNACPTDPTNPASQQMWANGTISRHNDDQAHLLSRTADPNNLTNYTEGTLGDAQPNGFLDWFPPSNVNSANAGVTPTGPTPVTDPTVLSSDFQQMVVGVHQFGCGIESQLETWYRFLIQPDPYASLGLDKSGKLAQWVGVDTTILAQRADFLRPDSLVAILVLTDENDSEVDVRSFGGSAWNFMSTTFNPPRGTSVCATDPGNTGCTSCGFGKNGGDAQCMTNGGKYTANTDWGMDLNLRHVHEKQKYGVSVQFPIQRYVIGLTGPRVPNRSSEYPNGATSYQGTVVSNLTCTNPLYAAKLPTAPSGGTWNPTADDLCNLTPGPRKPGLVFYAHIGGVPHQLLQEDPTNVDSPQKATLTDADWQLILGKDPETFDYTGIDPHMVEDYQQRTGVPVPSGGFKVSDQSSPEGTDPIAGREWQTNSASSSGVARHQGLLVDREYACIFKLATPRDCSSTAITADPTLNDSCDCTAPAANSGGAFTHAELPAVCNDSNNTTQDYAKAYPTIRELELAHLLGKVNGANEGIISSLCPIHTTDQSTDGMSDPLFGYRPAMNAIISRLSQALSNQCLPQRLTIDPTTNKVPCLVLGTFPSGPGSPASCTDPLLLGAYQDPDPTVLKEYRTDQHAQFEQGGGGSNGATDPSTELTCELVQLPPNMDCHSGSAEGWCYLVDQAKCAQEIVFSKDALKAGVTTSLQCLEASTNILGDGAAPAATAAPPAGDAGH